MTAAVLALCALVSARAVSPEVSVETLADGTTFVYAQVATQDAVSVRYVVRSGGADDPPGKAGLAHILEHLVFHGTYEEPEGVMFERAWGDGANINAFTTDDETAFVLDMPSQAFATLTPGFLAMVTSPALPFASFEREKGVVGAEHEDRPDVMTIGYAIDQLVFPAANGGVTVIGTPKSRDAITLDDIITFYGQHYVPKNSAVVVVGSISHDEAKKAVEAGLRGAPGAPAPPTEEREQPNLPSAVKILSYITVSADGLLVDGSKPGACEAAAGVLGLRLRKRVLAEETIAADIHAGCHKQRGHDFIVLSVTTTSPESSQVPDWMAAVIKSAAHTPPSAAEKALVESRHAAQVGRIHARAASLADALCFAIGPDDGTIEELVKQVATPPPLLWSQVPEVLQLAADPKHLAELHFSRFEQN